MVDVSKPKKQERCTKKLICGGYIVPPSRCPIPVAINRLGELEDKLEDGRLWESEMYFKAKAKLDQYEEVIKNGGALLTPRENLFWEEFIARWKEQGVKEYQKLLKEKYGIEVPDDGQLTDQGGKQ